ncbi:MAG: protein kinase [Oscillatoria sp. PMC 1068.18]|nr:protein kinase [Oscillatoria sp. PMC 1076.18]MEC4989454.1 protein kinase [Oscillatoria sp. PMC 1068.18]
MSAKVILTVTEGQLSGQKYVFTERNTCILGRANDCEPQFPDDKAHNTISRYHCLLDINPPAIRIRDFGSKNGTYVNGKKIGQRLSNQTPEEGAKSSFPEYDLNSGDEIKLGETVLQIGVEVAPETNTSQTIDVLKARLYRPPEVGEKRNLWGLVQNLLAKALRGEKKLLAIKGYSLLKKIGAGGFGEVYLAQNQETQQLVALKVMLPEVAAAADATKRFLREVENTKALRHPQIVQLLDYGYAEETFFFTLEYCDRGTVTDLLIQQGGKLPLDVALTITFAVLDALEYAHQAEIPYVKLADGTIGTGRGLVHRDIKPSNVLLATTPEGITIKVADFGLAKAFDLAGLSGLTMSGKDLRGTLAFMPRQQALQFKYAQPDVDVWAVAAMLYFLLTGSLPRNFREDKEPLAVLLGENPIPIRERDASIPKPLAEVIDLALRDSSQLHFTTATEFKQALESLFSA